MYWMASATQNVPGFDPYSTPQEKAVRLPRGKSKTFEYNGSFIRKSIYFQQTRNKWVVQWAFPDGKRRTQTFNCNVLGRDEALRQAEAVTPLDIPPEPYAVNQWEQRRFPDNNGPEEYGGEDNSQFRRVLQTSPYGGGGQFNFPNPFGVPQNMDMSAYLNPAALASMMSLFPTGFPFANPAGLDLGDLNQASAALTNAMTVSPSSGQGTGVTGPSPPSVAMSLHNPYGLAGASNALAPLNISHPQNSGVYTGEAEEHSTSNGSGSENHHHIMHHHQVYHHHGLGGVNSVNVGSLPADMSSVSLVHPPLSLSHTTQPQQENSTIIHSNNLSNSHSSMHGQPEQLSSSPPVAIQGRNTANVGMASLSAVNSHLHLHHHHASSAMPSADVLNAAAAAAQQPNFNFLQLMAGVDQATYNTFLGLIPGGVGAMPAGAAASCSNMQQAMQTNDGLPSVVHHHPNNGNALMNMSTTEGSNSSSPPRLSRSMTPIPHRQA